MPHAVDHTAILDRLAAMRGGTRNVFGALDPKRTAHLIVDMQNGFMEQGAPVEVPMARDIVSEVNRLSAAVRAAGGRNYFLRYTTPARRGAGLADHVGPARPRRRGRSSGCLHPGRALLADVAGHRNR